MITRGTRLVSTRQFKLTGLIHFSAPFTGSFKCTIPEGTIFIAVQEPIEGAAGFYAEPENKEEFEKFISKRDKDTEKYGGFSFILMNSYIGKKLEILKEN